MELNLTAERSDLLRMNIAQRREWLQEYVRRVGIGVAKSHGSLKRLSEMFGVHRNTISEDFKHVVENLKPVNLQEVEIDLRNCIYGTMVRSWHRSNDPDVDERARVRYGALTLQSAMVLIRHLECFGLKEKDMTPPVPVKETTNPVDQRMMDEFLTWWREKNRPNPPGFVLDSNAQAL